VTDAAFNVVHAQGRRPHFKAKSAIHFAFNVFTDSFPTNRPVLPHRAQVNNSYYIDSIYIKLERF
jgi:hypothetical protein